MAGILIRAAGKQARIVRKARLVGCQGKGKMSTLEAGVSPNVQRETTFPQGMSRRQAALPFR